MFSKSDKAGTSSAAKNGVPSILSANLHAHGNLVTDGEIQIDGAVEGDIEAIIVTVGEHAKITGHISADHVTVQGEVRGSIRAQTVHLAKTARVLGDVWHQTLSIEAGAHLEGQCTHSDQPRETGQQERGRLPESPVMIAQQATLSQHEISPELSYR